MGCCQKNATSHRTEKTNPEPSTPKLHSHDVRDPTAVVIYCLERQKGKKEDTKKRRKDESGRTRTRRSPMGMVEESEEQLYARMEAPGVVRVGATVDVARRRSEYERVSPGLYDSTFTMYYAKTSNMKRAEDRLLGRCDLDKCFQNIQHRSNVREKPGFVYVIM